MQLRKRAVAIAAALTLAGSVSFVAVDAAGSAFAATPVLTAPAQQGNEADGTLHWSTDPSANSYQVQTEDASGTLTATVNEPFWSPSYKAAAGTAKWRVASQSAGGAGRVWTAWVSLTGTTPPPAPTPTPTTPTPTPTTAACTTTAAKGSCGPYNDPAIYNTPGQDTTTVGNDMWNPIAGASESLSANSAENWSVTANMPTGNTAVVGFPNVGTTYSEPKVDGFSAITSSFTENMHATASTSAWAAYDIWLNSWAAEVMIQTDFANNGPCNEASHFTVAGQTWGLCTFGSERVLKLDGGNESSGTVDIKALLADLETSGNLPAASTLTDISFGWEICSTGAVPEQFSLSRFTVAAS